MIDEYNHRTEYFYDANGNTVEQTTGTDVVIYDYDDQNRLIYLDTGTSIIGYEYDAKGIRVAKTVDGEEQNYLVDHLQAYAQVLEETDASGALQARYTQGNDLLAMNRGSDVSYYHYDALGSTRALTDEAGVLTDAYDYEAYGEILQSSGLTENAFLFTGEQRDPESGNHYLRARYYDPEIGRFITRDTWRGEQERPLSLNKYLYAEGNPVVYTDPSGHFTMTQLTATVTLATRILTQIAVPAFGAYIAGCSSCSGREGESTLIWIFGDDHTVHNSAMGLEAKTIVETTAVKRKTSRWKERLINPGTRHRVNATFDGIEYPGDVAVIVFAHGYVSSNTPPYATDAAGMQWDIASSMNRLNAKGGVKGIFLGVCWSQYTVGQINVSGNVWRSPDEFEIDELYMLSNWIRALEMK